ncbi:hypothetical protein ACSMXM_05415 [Pacificimonas sp. ICDLI1SI03]
MKEDEKLQDFMQEVMALGRQAQRDGLSEESIIEALRHIADQAEENL